MGTDGFDSPPRAGDAPDACQYSGCDDRSVRVVGFSDPNEYLTFCKKHAIQQFGLPDAKSDTRLMP